MCRAWYFPLVAFAVLLLAGFLFLPTGPMSTYERPTPTPWPTPTPGPVKIQFLTAEWEREIAGLQRRIASECVETPERAINPYVCSGMRQVISLRRSSLGGTRAGVPVYIFNIGDERLREVTLPEVQLRIKTLREQERQYLADPSPRHWARDSGRWRVAWQKVEQMILDYERRKQ